MPELSQALADVTAAVEQVRAAEGDLERSREQLRTALIRAHDLDSSYALLGRLVGVSRQRVQRIIAGGK